MTKRKEIIRKPFFKFRGLSPLAAVLNAQPGAIDTGNKEIEKQCVIAALQKEVNEQKAALCVLVEIMSLPNAELYDRYQYHKWSELNPIVRKYLFQRFNISHYRINGLGIGHCYRIGVEAWSHEHVGQTLTRYGKTTFPISPKNLTDFTQSQLSEMIELMIETLNKKKEEENSSYCSCE